MPNIKQYIVRQHDTIKTIARKAFRDAARWPELIEFNGLVSPYIDTSVDPLDAYPGMRVLGIGDTLLVSLRASDPVVTGIYFDTENRDLYEYLLGTDLLLSQIPTTIISEPGQLHTNAGTGDFAVVSGTANLTQALVCRLMTRAGDLLYHPLYGTHLMDFIGRRSSYVNVRLAHLEALHSVLADPRIESVDRAITMSVDPEAVVSIDMTARVIGQETNTPLNLVVPRRT